MGDYVIEGNPALEGLIERLGAQGERPQPAEREPVVVKDDLWAILEDLREPTDAMVLVDFDEEPEVFDEDDGQILDTVASSSATGASPPCRPTPLTARTVNAEWWERTLLDHAEQEEPTE